MKKHNAKTTYKKEQNVRLGLFTFVSVILMIAVGSAVYGLNAESYILHFFGFELNYPIAVWVVLPMFVLFVLSFMHITIFGYKNHCSFSRWDKDMESFEDAIFASLLGEPIKEKRYFNETMKVTASVLTKAKIEMIDDVEEMTPKIAKALNIIKKIQSGEYVDLKEHKLHKMLQDGNPYLIQNRLNRLQHDDRFVEEVIKGGKLYSELVQKKALEIYASKANFIQARTFAKLFDVESFLTMLYRINKESEMGLTIPIFKEFLDGIKPSCSGFLRIAEVSKKLFTPNENLAIFFSYQIQTPKAQYAYLYLLFEYELIEDAGKFLDDQDKKDFVRFRVLYTLKKSNTKYKLEDLIDIYTICQETKTR